jgi:transcription elongation factor GreA
LFLKEFTTTKIAMTEVTYYTQDGLDKLRAEIHQMKGVGRQQISKAIAEARDKGDLSENAEYDAAKYTFDSKAN